MICMWEFFYEFRRNWFYLLFDKIEFDFVIYMRYNWINNVLFNGYQLLIFNFIVKLKIQENWFYIYIKGIKKKLKGLSLLLWTAQCSPQ